MMDGRLNLAGRHFPLVPEAIAIVLFVGTNDLGLKHQALPETKKKIKKK